MAKAGNRDEEIRRLGTQYLNGTQVKEFHLRCYACTSSELLREAQRSSTQDELMREPLGSAGRENMEDVKQRSSSEIPQGVPVLQTSLSNVMPASPDPNATPASPDPVLHPSRSDVAHASTVLHTEPPRPAAAGLKIEFEQVKDSLSNADGNTGVHGNSFRCTSGNGGGWSCKNHTDKRVAWTEAGDGAERRSSAVAIFNVQMVDEGKCGTERVQPSEYGRNCACV